MNISRNMYTILCFVCLSYSYLILKPWEEYRAKVEEKNQKVLSKDTSASLMTKKMNIKNITIRLIAGNKLPYVTVEHLNNSKIRISGYFGEIWLTLAKYLHFRTTLRNIKIDDERETLMKFYRYDIILSPVVLKASDLYHFEHTIPLAYTWYQLFSKIDLTDGNSFFYLSIWRTTLWVAFFMTILLLTVNLWLINHFREILNAGYFSKTPKRKRNVKADSSIATCFLSILGAVTNQGIQLAHSASSVRIVLVVSIIFGLVMTTSYSAILISKLATTGASSQEVASLENISAKKTHALCMSETSIVYTYFKASNSSRIDPKWEPVINREPCIVGESDIVPTEDYCADKTFVLESLHNTNFVWNNEPGNCRVQIHPKRYHKSYVTVLVRKGFPFTDLLSIYLLKFHTAGIIARLQERWLPPRVEKVITLPEYQYVVSFNHIREILMIYGVSVGVSVLVLLVECTFFHIYETKRSQNNILKPTTLKQYRW